MHHALRVRRFESTAHLDRDVHLLLNAYEAALTQERAKIATLHELHRDELDTLRLPQVENPNDIFVRYLARQDQFLFEAAQNFGLVRELRANDLQRDHAIHFAVASLVDRSHTAFAQRA